MKRDGNWTPTVGIKEYLSGKTEKKGKKRVLQIGIRAKGSKGTFITENQKKRKMAMEPESG